MTNLPSSSIFGEEITALLCALSDGSATIEEARAIERWALADRRALAAYVAYLGICVDLQWDLGAAAEEAKANRLIGKLVENDPSLRRERSETPPGEKKEQTHSAAAFRQSAWRRRGVVSLLFATAATVLILAVLAMIHTPQHARNKTIPTVESHAQETAPVGRLTALDGCRWDDDVALRPGAPLRAGQALTLQSGIAEITFRDGTVVLLEGPARFTPSASNSGRLNRGLLTAHVPRRAVGFTIDTPTASIVDLGTQFGVDVNDAGQTEVYVFAGQVELTEPHKDGEPAKHRKILAAGEAVRAIDARQPMIAIPHNTTRFDRALGILADKYPAASSIDNGQIVWLGNLFDDAKETPLDAAMQTDAFRAVATNERLGVERVLYGERGNGKILEIAPAIRFDLEALGWTGRSYGRVTNDAYIDFDTDGQPRGGISTRGRPIGENEPKIEDGIGAHADSIVTFDLAAIRLAGNLQDKRLRFIADRAGINDHLLKSLHSSIYLAAIVSNDQGIIAVTVNGKNVAVQSRRNVWFIASDVGPPLRADGRFAEFRVDLSPKAKYLTLVSAAAGDQMEEDNAVWSGARLEILDRETLLMPK